jgi:hypothetical protein
MAYARIKDAALLFRLWHDETLTVEDIAQRLGVSANTVWATARRFKMGRRDHVVREKRERKAIAAVEEVATHADFRLSPDIEEKARRCGTSGESRRCSPSATAGCTGERTAALRRLSDLLGCRDRAVVEGLASRVRRVGELRRGELGTDVDDEVSSTAIPAGRRRKDKPRGRTRRGRF